jgi:DNA polymerase (family 10)
VDTIEELARSEKGFGYEYVAITDHTKALGIENGMNERQLKKQMKKIESVNKKIRGIRILKGAELNIDSDGKLDIANKIIKDLDVVIASIHSGLRQDRKKITNRLISAMENEYVNIIGHPTGRKIQERRACDVDIVKLLEASKRTGTALEINSQPGRLDINADIARDAVKIGCKLAISTDAHSIDHLRYIKLGIATARRGWVQKRDVINTLPLKKLMKFFKK